jgi:hypothetical protein
MKINTIGIKTVLAVSVAAAFVASGFSTASVSAKVPFANLSLTEDFSGGALPDTLEESGPSPLYGGGLVTFPNDARRYLRTVANYDTTRFVADVTVTINDGQDGGNGIVFFGLGAGVAGGEFGEPVTAPAAMARVSPTDFFNFFSMATSTNDHLDYIAGLPGSGTHRLRISWDPSSALFTIAVHPNYTGGPFVSAQTFSEVLTEPFGPTDSRIFFGGAGNSTFDDLQVVTLPAAAPGTASCAGQTTLSLARAFGGIPQAAQAFGFSSVAALQTAIKASCGR